MSSSLTKELLRKLVHLIQLPIIAAYSFLHFYFSPQIGVLVLTGLLLLLLEIEYIRIDYQTRFGARLTEFFGKFILRRHERKNFTGAIFFLISAIIAFSAFEYQIALLALLLTVFGDLAASLIGKALGTKKLFRDKTYIGALSGLFVNLLVGLIILTSLPQVFIPMAVMGSLVETITQKLDDNLTVPLFAGFTGQIIVFLGHIALPNL